MSPGPIEAAKERALVLVAAVDDLAAVAEIERELQGRVGHDANHRPRRQQVVIESAVPAFANGAIQRHIEEIPK